MQAVKGMHDALPPQTRDWRRVERECRMALENYGYAEIRLPLLEKTELFSRSIGVGTDIVNKEMYTFRDRNDEPLSLRPEGTAGCARAVLENKLLAAGGPLRLWYGGAMFRYERPQKGRFRQFHQIGAEVFGLAGADIEAELLLVCARLWRRLGLPTSGKEALRLELNTLGDAAARSRYREELVAYFSAHRERLDADSERRLQTNPLRILDSKNPAMQDLIQTAPLLREHLSAESAERLEYLQTLLREADAPFEINPRLVRGLDYYNDTVFEWVSDQLGAQGTVCAGGRYDELVRHIGGPPTPAAGFALGLERLLALLWQTPAADADERVATADIYLVAVGREAETAARRIAEALRDARPDLRIAQHCGGGSFKSQMKKADKSGAVLALLLGEREAAEGTVALKPLRSGQEQQSVRQEELPEHIAAYF